MKNNFYHQRHGKKERDKLFIIFPESYSTIYKNKKYFLTLNFHNYLISS